ncbi:putative 26S proteasome non-ATPase regulatory subunit [Wickerhamomyces ciferrii]|uniref:26S proteasome non-ATPase regulatory subunit n=1 Tax=Wickerhamomyces ciferrii (strain ATCC 14091 / BCRC 22168 / CBS 111 / JCM 3599 / NBRC 0793 / NRRL Y-1031 F-60-10) TaxID=1206466 RepID=K0KIJ0_WICCF|nr:putative 26S proteasome non-ATPase regulatory subunit [Wickerhamomyces ciferrii]CCH42791.1 putative 26S proteasome non-ATPase regulatory subunit [Wickerhamomyces ciferrii]
MNGAMRNLNEGSYQPSYDIDQNNVNMDTSLVTLDGFPRSDINVIEVRNSRVKIIKLRNDLKAVINEISEKIQTQLTETNTSQETFKPNSQIPFAKIVEIIPNSPANKAVCFFR